MEEQNIENIDVRAYQENEIATKLYNKFGFKPLWTNFRLLNK